MQTTESCVPERPQLHSRRYFLPCSLLATLAGRCIGSVIEPEAAQRERMVQLIEARGIRTPELLAILREVPRHLFVPEPQRQNAYDDGPLSIGYGATISQPYIVALMTDLLRVRKSDRVLEIGTGSGYQTAILAKLSSWVFSLELVPELARSARNRLENMGYRNVTVHQGDGFAGWQEYAPFDRIMLTACPVELPDTLVRQLAVGGRLVAPLGPVGRQELMAVQKEKNGNLTWTSAGPVVVLPMRSSR